MSRTCSKILFVCLLVNCFFLLSSFATAFAQEASQQPVAQARRESAVNMNAQIYLLVGSNQAAANERIPPSLEGVVRELRASLPYKNYRVATTLVSRVQDGGRLALRWSGGTLFTPTANDQTFLRTPGINEFKVDSIRLVEDGQGRPAIRITNLAFETKFPIQVGTTLAANGTGAAPEILYEHTGIWTNISLRDGEPAVVGTLSVGPEGDALILVVSFKLAPSF